MTKFLVSLLFFLSLQGRREDENLRRVWVVLNYEKSLDSLQEKISNKPKEERRKFVRDFLSLRSKQTMEKVLTQLRELEQDGKVRNIKKLPMIGRILLDAEIEEVEVIAKMEGVREIHLSYKEKVLGELKENKGKELIQSDTSWAVKWIGAPFVWEEGYKGEGTKVALLGTGVWYYHPDLSSRIWQNPMEIPFNGVDEDSNGYVDDYYGYDWVNDDPDPLDDNGHGTRIAGVVVGDGTDGILTGVAPQSSIILLKVVDQYGSGDPTDVIAAIDYALLVGADIILIPFGFFYAEEWVRHDLREAAYIARLSGCTVVAPSGNERGWFEPPNLIRTPGDVPPPWSSLYPPDSSLAGVITVGGTAYMQDTLAYFSSPGPVTWMDVEPWMDWDYPPGLTKPDLSAPAINILSTEMNGGYSGESLSGTSLASALVAGAISLLLSKSPNLSPSSIDSILELTALDLGEGGKDNDYGAGRIRVDIASQMVNFPSHDLGVIEILSPSSTISPGVPFNPSAVIRNFGVNAESFDFFCSISRGDTIVYRDSLLGLQIQPSSLDTFVFVPFTPYPGAYSIVFSLYLESDENPSNDSILRLFFCRITGNQYLVLDLDPNHSSGPKIDSILLELGYRGTYSTSPSFADSVSNFSSLWLCLGIWPEKYVIADTSQLAMAIVDYLEGGGNVYMEGGDCWYWDPLYEDGYDFGPYFGIEGLSDGIGDLSTVSGEQGTFTEGIAMSYGGENNYIDRLIPFGGFPILSNDPNFYYCGIANDNGVYRTIGISFELGRLNDSTGISTREHLIDTMMAFFGIEPNPYYIPGDANADGRVDEEDVIYLSNWLYWGGPEPDPLLAGDANGDCDVDLEDILYLIEYLRRGGPPPQECGTSR